MRVQFLEELAGQAATSLVFSHFPSDLNRHVDPKRPLAVVLGSKAYLDLFFLHDIYS